MPVFQCDPSTRLETYGNDLLQACRGAEAEVECWPELIRDSAAAKETRGQQSPLAWLISLRQFTDFAFLVRGRNQRPIRWSRAATLCAHFSKGCQTAAPQLPGPA